MVGLASIAWHHDLAQAAPVAALGTLRWQVSKMAFDAAKVLLIFFVKNLTMALMHPMRYGQLRAPLVEQRVPDNVEAAAGGSGGVMPSSAETGSHSSSSSSSTGAHLIE